MGDVHVGGGTGADTIFGGAGVEDEGVVAGDSGTRLADRDVVKDFVCGEDVRAPAGSGRETVFAGTTARADCAWYPAWSGGVTLPVDDDGSRGADFRVDPGGISSLRAADPGIGRFEENGIDATPFQDDGLWQFRTADARG